MPDPRTPFTSLEFCSAIQNKAGAHQSALTGLVGRPIKSSAQTTLVVDPSGYNIKKAQGAKHDGTRQHHDAHVNAISKGLASARIRHKGGRNGNPRTCKDIFSGISVPTEEGTRAYQHIIPDLEINGRPLDEGPLAGKIFLADVKTLSPCDAYTDNQTGEPNAAVNARQKRVNLDYHAKAQRLDEHYGCNESHGFKARLNSHGRDGVVLGPVIGAFGEMSDDIKHIADAIATELANEHCSYYSDKKPKTVRSYFRNQLYRSWGLGAHRGWARLLLDRRCLVGTSNAPRGCSNRSNYRSAHDEETAYDSYMNPEPGFRAGPGDSYDAA